MISAYNIYAYKQQAMRYICTTLQSENNRTFTVNIGNIELDGQSN